MIQMTQRGLKIFFKDKGAVFFSLLGVIIIFSLFIFFIGDALTEGLEYLDNKDYVMNSWVVAGMLVRPVLHSSSVYSYHLFLMSSASVRSIPFLSFSEPIFA